MYLVSESSYVTCPGEVSPERETDEWLPGAGDIGEVTAGGYGVSFRGDANVLELIRHDGFTAL